MFEFFTGDFAGLSAVVWNWIATGICILFAMLLLIAAIKFLRGPKLGGRKNRNARLAVTDATAIGDDRRKLVLVRRDNVEHLLLIGGPSDLVIETNIIKAVAPNQAATSAAKQIPDVPREVQRQAPSLLQPAQTAQPAPITETPKPAPVIAPSKPAVSPEPAPQPVVAPTPTVAPQVTAPTAPTTSPPKTSPTTSGATAAAVVTAPIVAAATTESVSEPAETAESSATPSEKPVTKLDPVEEMDALLSEISTDK